MDRTKTNEEERAIAVDQSSNSQRSEKIPSDPVEAEPEHVHAKTILLLIAIVGIYWVQVVHSTGVGVAANAITALTGGGSRATWLTKTIAIVAGSLSAPVSQAADLWGRKWFVVGFTYCGAIGSLIASRADRFPQLIVGQTIGSFHAGAQTLIHAIASEILPRKYRPFAQAATAAAGGLGGITGSLLAGGLTKEDPNNWRIYFYILTALYVIMSTVVLIFYNPPPRKLQLELTQREKLARLDWIGYALLIPGIVLFGFALTSSAAVYAWDSVEVLTTLIIGAICLIVFVLYEWLVKKDGMLHHALFHGRNFPIAFGAFFVEGVIFFATNAYYSYEAASIFGKPLFTASGFYAVGWGVEIIATFATGFYCTRTKTLRTPLVVSFTFFTIFCALMASLNPSTNDANIVGYVVFFGIAIGIALNALVTVSQLSTPRELISITTGLIIGVRSVGGTVGLSIYTAIFNNTSKDQVPRKVAAAAEAFPAFDPANLRTFISGLTSRNTTLLESIPGVTPELIQAGTAAVVEGNSLAFRYVWVAAASFCAVVAIALSFLIDPKGEFTEHIDAPIETKEQLHREGIMEKLHHRRPHSHSHSEA